MAIMKLMHHNEHSIAYSMNSLRINLSILLLFHPYSLLPRHTKHKLSHWNYTF